SDGGLNWSPDNTNTIANLREITAHGTYFVAVGDAGTTLRKVNSSAVWDTTLSPVAQSVRSVASNGVVPGILIAVGDGGLVLRSTDQGLSWSPQFLAGAPNLHGVAPGSTNTYFVAVGQGGKIFRSSNLGVDWEDVSNSAVTANLNDVASDETNRFV